MYVLVIPYATLKSIKLTKLSPHMFMTKGFSKVLMSKWGVNEHSMEQEILAIHDLNADKNTKTNMRIFGSSLSFVLDGICGFTFYHFSGIYCFELLNLQTPTLFPTLSS